MSCSTSPQGYQIALLLHPVNGVPKWWQIIVFKKFVKKLCFIDEFVNIFYRTMKSVVSIKIKNMPLANLIHKIKSQWLFKNNYNKQERA